MLRLCGLAVSIRTPTLNSLNILSSSSSQALPARARILITSCVADSEALSACEVFMFMLQNHLRVECAVVQSARQMASWKPWAYYLVVLLFRGMFRDHSFAKIMLHASERALSWPSGRSLELVSVIADTHFDFPSMESLEPDAYIWQTDGDQHGDQLLPELADAKLLYVSLLHHSSLRRSERAGRLF